MARSGACLQRGGQEGAADGDGHRRQLAALGQEVDGGLPDGLDARAAGPPRIEGLLGVLQAEAAAPVHVRQSGGGRPAQTCTPTCTSQRASPSNLRCDINMQENNARLCQKQLQTQHAAGNGILRM